MNETDKLIEEQLKTLPTELREAIRIVPWKSMVQEIGRGNNLDAGEMAKLERETMLIVYAFEDPLGYSENLMRELKIDVEKATKISDEVWQKIMQPISDATNRENVVPPNLPMVEPGETAHIVPHIEEKGPEKPQISTPASHYPGGVDPYREPLV